MKLNCDGDYELQQAWLEKHRDADVLVFDQNSQLPVKAVYMNPIYQSYVAEPKTFWGKVLELTGEDTRRKMQP